MIRNTLQTPAGIPTGEWTSAAVFARMGNRPFYVKRFAPGDERKTFVFFGEIVLPLTLAMPLMIRMHKSDLVIGKTKERLYTELDNYFKPSSFEFVNQPSNGIKMGEIIVISGFVSGGKPNPESYYGIREYVKERTEEGENLLEQFMLALSKP